MVAGFREKPKRFIARVSSLRGWYAIGDEYIITEKDHTGYFHVYSKKRPHGCPLGSYLDNFFEIIEPFDEKKDEEPEKTPWSNVLNADREKSEKCKENVQLNLFDLI